jgi:hypothetical protein
MFLLYSMKSTGLIFLVEILAQRLALDAIVVSLVASH